MVKLCNIFVHRLCVCSHLDILAQSDAKLAVGKIDITDTVQTAPLRFTLEMQHCDDMKSLELASIRK